MLWVTVIVLLWLFLVVAVIAICRAAAVGDKSETFIELERARRFARGGQAPLASRRRSGVG